MKNRKLTIILITFLGIIALLLTILLVFLLNNKTNFNHFHFSFGNTISNELVLDEHYENVFEKIIINTNASKIDVYESIDNDIRLYVENFIKELDTGYKQFSNSTEFEFYYDSDYKAFAKRQGRQ